MALPRAQSCEYDPRSLPQLNVNRGLHVSDTIHLPIYKHAIKLYSAIYPCFQAEDKDMGLGVGCRVIRENALPLSFPCATSSVGRLKINQMHVCSI